MKQFTILFISIIFSISNVDAKDASPLNVAVVSNNIKEVRALLDNGENQNGNGRGYSPLTLACTYGYGYIDIIALLLERGADINIKSHMTPRLTPLMAAAQAGHKNVVTFLLEKGADPSLLDERGRDARQIALAEASNYEQIANLLSKKTEQDAAGNLCPVQNLK